MRNFDFYSPTYFVFGKDREAETGRYVKRFGGSRVLVVYGGQSAKRSGLLDRIMACLKEENLYAVELGGVKPNPRSGLVYEGIELCRREKVVAVGEIGLDHHWPVPRQEQYDLFEAQLQLAKELDLPVSVHDREAHAEMYELLRKYKPRGALHCYSGSADDAAWLVEQGMYLGFGGAVTYKGAKRAARVLAAIPHDRALLETDCPYMAPEPHRGERNDPGYIPLICGKMAEIKGVSADEMAKRVEENGARLFGI